MESNINPESVLQGIESGEIKKAPEMFWDHFCHCPSQKAKEGKCKYCGGPING